MIDFSDLIKKRKIEKFRLGLTEADKNWEPKMVVSGEPHPTTYLKRGVTNVAQSKGAGATEDMMPEEREDYISSKMANEAYEKALMESEEEKKKKKQR